MHVTSSCTNMVSKKSERNLHFWNAAGSVAMCRLAGTKKSGDAGGVVVARWLT
jgi:hypothetical protein